MMLSNPEQGSLLAAEKGLISPEQAERVKTVLDRMQEAADQAASAKGEVDVAKKNRTETSKAIAEEMANIDLTYDRDVKAAAAKETAANKRLSAEERAVAKREQDAMDAVNQARMKQKYDNLSTSGKLADVENRLKTAREEVSFAESGGDKMGAASAAMRVISLENERNSLKDQIDESRSDARSAVAKYRHGKMSDEERLTHHERGVSEVRERLASAQDPMERSSLVKQLVEQMSAVDGIKSKIDSKKDGGDIVGTHKEAIQDIRNQRATTAMDTQSVFQHMYDVKAGKNPDELVAENTKKIEEHMASIAKVMEGAGNP
jgi:hypothetical protein